MLRCTAVADAVVAAIAAAAVLFVVAATADLPLPQLLAIATASAGNNVLL